MNRETIDNLVNKAIDLLVDNEPQLLDLNVTERALSHHLARYLGELVPEGFNVDCEYNRHFDDPKRLNLKRRQAKDREIRATTVFPDIIVHKRDSDTDNLLVLEMKKPGESLIYDQAKLLAFRNQLKYIHTAHVILGRRNGELVKEVLW
ncbi:MAG: hypothetical protein WAU17_10220, partial [Nitrospirales bacterium]